VGVNIEMTPTVHFDHDVTLKIKIEDSSENGTETISGVTEPIIAQKTSEQVIRLREGEASVLTGILNKQEIASWSGIPGLSSIPGLKYLFGSKDHQIQEDEIVFLLIPHIVRSQDLGPANLRTIDTGVGQSIDLRHVPVEAPVRREATGLGLGPGSDPGLTTQPPVRPAANTHSTLGTVPGQSVETAAPAALAQLRAAAEASPPAAKIVPPAPTTGVSFTLSPLGAPVISGSTFQIPVVLQGGSDIAAAPIQITYDATKLSLVNLASGEFLSKDGQSVALVHRDDGPGNIKLNVSRPPGAPGVSGSGVVCVLSFQAKAVGDSVIAITRPSALNSAQQSVPATGGQITVTVK